MLRRTSLRSPSITACGRARARSRRREAARRAPRGSPSDHALDRREAGHRPAGEGARRALPPAARGGAPRRRALRRHRPHPRRPGRDGAVPPRARQRSFRPRRMARVSPLGLPAMRDAGDSPALVRPLLDIPKARLIATLAAAGLGHAEDPSNARPALCPGALAQARAGAGAGGPDRARLAQLARRVRRSEAAIEAVVTAAFDRLGSRAAAHAIAFDAGGLRELPAEIALRLIGRAVGAVGDEGPVELGKLEALCESLQCRVLHRPLSPHAGRRLGVAAKRSPYGGACAAAPPRSAGTFTELKPCGHLPAGRVPLRRGAFIVRALSLPERFRPAWQRGQGHLHWVRRVAGRSVRLELIA